jgi:CubicO group peptidase (beta-lactamase class C family)
MIHTTAVLDRAVETRAFAAVTAEVGHTRSVSWTYAAGQFGYDDDRTVTSGTIFDLASLTKVLCTTTLTLPLIEHGTLRLETPVEAIAAHWTGTDRATVTVRDLLEHCSGLPAYRPYYLTFAGRAAYEAAIAAEPLEYRPRTHAIYSDLGFILLGFIIEATTGEPLDRQFERWRAGAGIEAPLIFNPTTSTREHIALTERDPWRGRLLRGEVHDENAAALGGVAGHAGLFGTAAAVGEAARWWLARLTGLDDPTTGISAATAALCAKRSSVPGSSRGLGWDTMLPTSSCGTRWSASAIGHTGFTGTSLWLDPASDRYAVLLTNRVHPTRDNDRIQQVRRDFHDAVATDMEGTAPDRIDHRP